MRGRPARAASRASSGASSRWTATTAGTASSAPTTCSCTGIAEHAAPTASAAARAAYERGETDEFIAPTRVGEEGAIRPGDSVIAFNFRPDRMRELSRALAEPACPEIDRRGAPPVARYTTLTEYGGTLGDHPVIFRPHAPDGDAAARHRRRAAGASCTSPRPRSTRT